LTLDFCFVRYIELSDDGFILKSTGTNLRVLYFLFALCSTFLVANALTLVRIPDFEEPNTAFLGILPENLQNRIYAVSVAAKDFKVRWADELTSFIHQDHAVFKDQEKELLVNLLCNFDLAVKQVSENPREKICDFCKGMSKLYDYEDQLQDQFVADKIAAVKESIIQLAEKQERRKFYLDELKSMLETVTVTVAAILISHLFIDWWQSRSAVVTANIGYYIRRLLPRAFEKEVHEKGLHSNRAAFKKHLQTIFKSTSATIERSIIFGFYCYPEVTLAKFGNSSKTAGMLNDLFKELAILREYARALEMENIKQAIIAAAVKISNEIAAQKLKFPDEISALARKAMVDISAAILSDKFE
jgi:hypothetical protein